MNTMSNGALNAARDCKRLYYYRYELGLQRRGGDDSPALNYGRLWHRVLARWFERRTLDGMQAFVESCAASQDDIERCMAMLAGYIARWPAFPKMSLHEVEILVPISNPVTGRCSQRFTQFGFLDMFELSQDGRIRLVEHKTAASIGGGYIEKLWSDSQITGYYAALQDMGIDVESVVYDVALKPKIRQKKTESLDEFYLRLGDWHMQPEAYHREEILVSERQVQDWRTDVWQVTQELLACRRSGYWYRNTSRCWDWYRPCQFMSLCQNGASEVLLNSEYEKRESPSSNHNQTTETPVF